MKLIFPVFYGLDPQNANLGPDERLNEARLSTFLTDAGLDTENVLTISSETAFKQGLAFEEEAKQLPILDYNKQRLQAKATKWVKLAILLENREKYFDRLKPTKEMP